MLMVKKAPSKYSSFHYLTMHNLTDQQKTIILTKWRPINIEDIEIN